MKSLKTKSEKVRKKKKVSERVLFVPPYGAAVLLQFILFYFILFTNSNSAMYLFLPDLHNTQPRISYLPTRGFQGQLIMNNCFSFNLLSAFKTVAQ